MKVRFLYLVGILFVQYTIAQNRAFLNGGFEDPTFTNTKEFQYFISNDAPTGTLGTRTKEWNTTATDYQIEYRRDKGSDGELSAEGTQHVEINATQGGTRLYQNVCLIQGETFNYSYYHRGRKGRDVMKVKLYGTTVPSDSMVLKNSSTDETAWQFYFEDNRLVSIPSGTYQFSFESVSSYNNVASEVT